LSSLEDELVVDPRKRMLMDRVANWVLDSKMEEYVTSFLELYGRVEILGQMAYLELVPILAAFYGKDGMDISDMLALNPREGTAYLQKRIREMKAEREKLSLPIEDGESSNDSSITSWFSEKFSWLLKRLRK
jgi:hypothetical protein